MKICNICNSMNDDDSKFCLKCGNSFVQANPQMNQQTQQQNFQQQTQHQPNNNSQRAASGAKEIRPTGTGRFVNADEYVIATLENGIAMNLISGEGFRKEDAILTNRRLYYNHKDGIINVRECEEKVNVKDITGTKIASINPLGFLILSIIALILALIVAAGSGVFGTFFAILPTAVMFFVLYLILKKKFLRIEYAGGAINFSVKKYGMQNIRLFQKSIHSVKDYIEDTK